MKKNTGINYQLKHLWGVRKLDSYFSSLNLEAG